MDRDLFASPDCTARKHGACTGDAWDEDNDEMVACACGCHQDRWPS